MLVAQSSWGVRLFDTITGEELEHTDGRETVYQAAPTNRHALHLRSINVRFAEVMAGRPFIRFQTGWKRLGGVNRPPAEPGTLPLQMIGNPAGWVILSQFGTDIFKVTHPLPLWHWTMPDCALSANHRFAVGHLRTERWLSLCDLATEAIAAKLLPPDWELREPQRTRAVFTPDETRVVAVTQNTLMVFDLPPPLELPEPEPEPEQPQLSLFGRLKAALTRTGPYAPRRETVFPAPPAAMVEPTLAVLLTQPQPDQNIPPFAVLPCGQKIIIRGTKSRVELRDIATGEVLTVWKWGLPRQTALACAADGLTAAAGGTGGQMILWDLA